MKRFGDKPEFSFASRLVHALRVQFGRGGVPVQSAHRRCPNHQRRCVVRKVVGVALALAFAGLCGFLWADEEKVPLDKLPKPVLDAVKKRFPKGELVAASKETADGKTEYEVSLKDGGKKIDATLTSDG